MTKMSGTSNIIPKMRICDFEFKPCGYSMNGMLDYGLSTVLISPKEEFSYASYEMMGFNPEKLEFGGLVYRGLKCFDPREFSFVVTMFGGHEKQGAITTFLRWISIGVWVMRSKRWRVM